MDPLMQIFTSYGPVGLMAGIFYLAWRDMGKRLSEVTDRFIAYLEEHGAADREADARILQALERIDLNRRRSA